MLVARAATLSRGTNAANGVCVGESGLLGGGAAGADPTRLGKAESTFGFNVPTPPESAIARELELPGGSFSRAV